MGSTFRTHCDPLQNPSFPASSSFSLLPSSPSPPAFRPSVTARARAAPAAASSPASKGRPLSLHSRKHSRDVSASAVRDRICSPRKRSQLPHTRERQKGRRQSARRVVWAAVGPIFEARARERARARVCVLVRICVPVHVHMEQKCNRAGTSECECVRARAGECVSAGGRGQASERASAEGCQ
eukprot:6202064-Pleurochrysis_carterae.AAC.1